MNASNNMQEDIVVVSDESCVPTETAKEVAELKLMLRKQDMAIERLPHPLAAAEIDKKREDEIPDWTLEEIERFFDEGPDYSLDE